MDKVQEYLNQLRDFKWFSRCRDILVNASESVVQVTSWEEALKWTEHPVTNWCGIEAKKILYDTKY